MDLRDILEKCRELAKSFTEEDIKKLRDDFDAMPDNSYYETPSGMELVYLDENWTNGKETIDVIESDYNFIDNKNNFYCYNDINESFIDEEYLAVTA